MRKMGQRPLPTIILVAGELTFEDGSRIDSRQSAADESIERAVRESLTASPEWWSTVASIVIPTLDDSEGGFAITHQKSLWLREPSGVSKQIRLPPYPRAQGDQRYIYNLSSFFRIHGRPPNAKTRPSDARVQIDLDGAIVGCLRAGSTMYDRTKIVIAPDTPRVREIVDVVRAGGKPEGGRRPFVAQARMPLASARCRVTGLVQGGEWVDASGLEAARLLLLSRFDLKVGLWDLAMNPILRSTLLVTSAPQVVPSARAQMPAATERRIERRVSGPEEARDNIYKTLVATLAGAGWTYSLPTLVRSLFPVWGGTLVLEVEKTRLLIFLVSPAATNRSLYGFVQAHRAAFEEIAHLPGPLTSPSTEQRKERKRLQQRRTRRRPAGRALLWTYDHGWSDKGIEWSEIAVSIADLTAKWIDLLTLAPLKSSRLDRRKL